MNWHDPRKKPPDPFVSVLVYIPSEYPLPTVHEGYMASDRVWYANGSFYNDSEIHSWANMPEYAPDDNNDSGFETTESW